MYAVITNVNIAPGSFEHARKELETNVVPRVRQAPGFVKGYWYIRSDNAQGISTIVFKTKEDADNAVNMISSSPMPQGVSPSSVEVREVIAEA
jgi:hypothetical protein